MNRMDEESGGLEKKTCVCKTTLRALTRAVAAFYDSEVRGGRSELSPPSAAPVSTPYLLLYMKL